MGAGASAVDAALSKLSTASDAEVRAAVEELPLDQRSRIAEQLKEVDTPGETGEADNSAKTQTITVRTVGGDALLESLEAPKTTAEILTLLEKSDSRPGPHYRPKLLLKEEMLKATQVVGESGAGEVTELSVIWEADLYLKKENFIREMIEAEAVLECLREIGDGEKVEEQEKKVHEARLAIKRAELEIMHDNFKQVVVNVVFEPGVELEKKDLLSTAFNKIDFDETGKISFKNLKWVIKGKAEGFKCMGGKVGELTDEELQEIIDEADRDEDGEIDQYEFARFFKDVKF